MYCYSRHLVHCCFIVVMCMFVWVRINAIVIVPAQDMVEALKALSAFFTDNSLRSRRNLRGDIEKRSLAINENFEDAFRDVKEVCILCSFRVRLFHFYLHFWGLSPNVVACGIIVICPWCGPGLCLVETVKWFPDIPFNNCLWTNNIIVTFQRQFWPAKIYLNRTGSWQKFVALPKQNCKWD